MKKNIIYIAALVVLTAACSNEDDNILSGGENNGIVEVKMITETITAIDGDGSASTRAAVAANASFTWSTGDQVAVHVSNGQYYTSNALASGGSNTATFTVTYPDGQSRDAFAVYPASIVAADAANYGQSGTALDVTLPGSYAIGEVSGTTTPCPMIADNTGSGWTFKQLCGMLRLTVNNIPATATYLKIDFNGKKVQGAFSIASPVAAGTSTIATSATTGTDDIITITGLDGSAANYDINLPLPTGDYTDVTVTAYNSSDAAILSVLRPMKASGTYTAARAKGRKVTATLPGLFTINDSGTKVAFAPGNLQATYNGSAWSWAFATNQWDYIGNAAANTSINGNGTVSTNGTVDLFGWVGASSTWTGAAQYGISNSTTNNSTDTYGNVWNEALKSDWGNTISDGYTWRTLTSAEWVYIFGTRTGATSVNGTANGRFTQATINTDVGTGVFGMILFPDGVTIANGEATSWGNINNNSIGGTTMCTSAQWTALAAKGCVFLPAAGRRGGSAFDMAGYGFYWSSSPYNASNANYMYFKSGDLWQSYTAGRNWGCSVRLVRVVN